MQGIGANEKAPTLCRGQDAALADIEQARTQMGRALQILAAHHRHDPERLRELPIAGDQLDRIGTTVHRLSSEGEDEQEAQKRWRLR